MKRSALFHCHQRAGATFREYQGWQLPEFFSTPAAEAAHVRSVAGLADISQSNGGIQPFACLLLAGPRASDVLAKLSSLNTTGLSRAQASVAHVHCAIEREDLPGIPAYRLLITRDYAESSWEAMLRAGHEFPLWPFGLRALESLRA